LEPTIGWSSPGPEPEAAHRGLCLGGFPGGCSWWPVPRPALTPLGDAQLGRAAAGVGLGLGFAGDQGLASDPLQAFIALFENRKGEGKVSEVRGKLAALAKREEWLQREWRNRLQQNRVSLETTRSQLELQEQEVADAERMAKAEMKRLQQGDSDVFFVNVREQDEADARIRLLETKSLHEIMVLERRSLDGELLQLLSSYLPKEFQ
jgi:hypothetical protein